MVDDTDMEQNDSMRWIPPGLKGWPLYLVLAIGGLVGIYTMLYIGLAPGILFYLAPFFVLFLVLSLSSPLFCFFLLYAISFSIMGIGRYVSLPLPPGVIIDLLIVFNLLTLALHYVGGQSLAGVRFNAFLGLAILWMFFCFFQLLNPMNSVTNWATTVRSIGIHIVVFQVLASVNLHHMDKLRLFFKVWAGLVVLAALKAIGQKHVGFDAAESSWLYTSGAHTHVIHSGTRYFSFFTDAANFGCHMGLAIVVFTILAFYEQSTNRRLLYGGVVLLAAYGMMISGTRAAIAVPFIGFAFAVVLIKEWKWMITGLLLVACAYCFFNFTNIGNSNADIRRMRTAFRFTEDASFNVRLENQKKMRQFMHKHPFGLGIGSSKHTNEGDVMHGIATDSSFVFIWVETGMVGLVAYVLLCLCILGFGTYYTVVVVQTPAVKGVVMASTAGLAGIMVAGYANEVLHQTPTGPTIYILMAVIMLSPMLDKQQTHEERML